ncbi:MAG: hypothetical protein HC880_21910 [Bacteroidia bacterium]|nr:hypothetical protein [Bacteroidia bacterium]
MFQFWIAGDDGVELWLSSDVSENNVQQIAYHSTWNTYDEWNKVSTQKSAAVYLVAGQQYYIDAYMKEGGGGDFMQVGWRKP